MTEPHHPQTPVTSEAQRDTSGLVEHVDGALARLAAAGLFSGTVVITQDGEPLLACAHGLADRDVARAVSIDTRFNVGSMKKMFTAVAVLQLASAGTLSLDSRLVEVLPSYPNAAVARQVTIHQLLTHTAGLGDFLMGMISAPAREYCRLEDYLGFFVDDDLAFEPGTSWAYSNGGYLVLGLVIEALTDRPYAEVIRDNVLLPAGMQHTGFAQSPSEGDLHAINYSRMLSPDGVEAAYCLPGQGGPAGGGFSTTGDLTRFARALQQNILLDSTWTERLTTGKVDLAGAGGPRYAYGFFVEDLRGLQLVGHGGGGPGINGELTMYAGTGYTLAVLANIDPPAATNVRRLFEGLLLEATGRLPAPAAHGNTEFSLPGHDNAHLVTVYGDFNGWQTYEHRLSRVDDRWVGRIELAPGRYLYRYFVDGREELDPLNPERQIAPGPLRQEFSVIAVE